MGKSKKKSSNVFQVAGAKSLKLKAKAKAVKTALKHINIKNKHDVQEIDKALIYLEDRIRQTAPSAKQLEELTKSRLPTTNTEEARIVKEKAETTVEDLNNLQL
nr:unnamed protein product [Callosobruchus analis]